jgi:hypothetical protein
MDAEIYLAQPRFIADRPWQFKEWGWPPACVGVAKSKSIQILSHCHHRQRDLEPLCSRRRCRWNTLLTGRSRSRSCLPLDHGPSVDGPSQQDSKIVKCNHNGHCYHASAPKPTAGCLLFSLATLCVRCPTVSPSITIWTRSARTADCPSTDLHARETRRCE